jgi:hypothetical protein
MAKVKSDQIAWLVSAVVISTACALLIVWFFGRDDLMSRPQTGKPEVRAPAPASTATGFDTWRFTGLIGQANAAKAPDGTNTAYKLTENLDKASRSVSAVINFDPAKPMGASLFARYGNGRRLLIYLATDVNRISCDVDLQSGKTSLQATGAAQPGRCDAIAQSEGWWRIELQGIVSPRGSSTITVLGIAPTKAPFEDAYEAGDGYVLIWNAAVSQTDSPVR